MVVNLQANGTTVRALLTIIDPGESGTYLLVFDAAHLGKGTRLFLSLPNRVFEVLKDEQIIRFDQAVVEPMAGSSAPDLSPAAALAIEIATATVNAAATAALDAQVADWWRD